MNNPNKFRKWLILKQANIPDDKIIPEYIIEQTGDQKIHYHHENSPVENNNDGSKQIENSNQKASLVIPGKSNNPWFIIGGTVTGHGHIAENIPCQDSHKVQIWKNGWGIAVVSDGAGSAKKSQLGSSFLTEETARRAYKLVMDKKWIETSTFPRKGEWKKLSHRLFCDIKDSMFKYSVSIKTSIEELHATLIMIIFSHQGLLVAHVGDGRAGCLDEDGNLFSVIRPLQGEYINETVFMTVDFETNDRFFESRVINKPVKAFFILTDGCENVCWETNKKDEKTGNYIKPNKPFKPFFTHTVDILQNIGKHDSPEELKEKWLNYLDKGHRGFQIETDDKTMVIGIIAK